VAFVWLSISRDRDTTELHTEQLSRWCIRHVLEHSPDDTKVLSRSEEHRVERRLDREHLEVPNEIDLDVDLGFVAIVKPIEEIRDEIIGDLDVSNA